MRCWIATALSSAAAVYVVARKARRSPWASVPTNLVHRLQRGVLARNRQYCYPLTVTDHASRYLLTCEALCSNQEDYAFRVFDRFFSAAGLPTTLPREN